MTENKTYITSKESNKVFKQSLRALDENLVGKFLFKKFVI